MQVLLKPGEIMLKKSNRRRFEAALKRNIHQRIPGSHVRIRSGRFYLELPSSLYPAPSPEQGLDSIAERLSTLPGITSFAAMHSCPKEDAAIEQLTCDIAKTQVAKYGAKSSFRISVRRTDKSLALDSQAYAIKLGALVQHHYPDLQVRLKGADWKIALELREQAYLYGDELLGAGGLPSGSSGRGMLLLSGGIDSPVAGYAMARRGMRIEAVYFDTPPFTTEAAYSKVSRLAARIACWNGPVLLHRIPFTNLQLALRKHCSAGSLTLQSRACMVVLAERLAQERRCLALVSGEALSQVASQTIENLGYTNRFATLPILRPLISRDKEDIITDSRKLGCFEISIEPHVDCCSYFAPEHPITKANADALSQEFYALPQLTEHLEQALNTHTSQEILPAWSHNKPPQ